MKKFLIASAFMFTVGAFAQQGQPNDDQLQQQAPRPTQVRVEHTATNAARNQSANEIEAEKAAKDKGQTQTQTKTQPNGLPPNLTDTINPPKQPDRVIPAKE